MIRFSFMVVLATIAISSCNGFTLMKNTGICSSTSLSMAMDSAMESRLMGIKRSYQALTERLGDPDVIADSKLLMKVMSDRSKSEDVVNAFDEVCSIYA